MEKLLKIKHGPLFLEMSFKRLYSGAASASQTYIAGLVKAHPVVAFVKGTQLQPQCGFSRAVIKVLELHELDSSKLNVVNCLEPTSDGFLLRDEIKKFSDWPTIPQIYVSGEFIGGCDLLVEMHQSGELDKLLDPIRLKA